MSVEDWLPPFDSDLANDSCDLNRSLAAFPGNGWSTSEPVFAEMRCHAKTLTVQGQSADRIRRPRHHAADPEQLYESFNSTPESSNQCPLLPSMGWMPDDQTALVRWQAQTLAAVLFLTAIKKERLSTPSPVNVDRRRAGLSSRTRTSG